MLSRERRLANKAPINIHSKIHKATTATAAASAVVTKTSTSKSTVVKATTARRNAIFQNDTNELKNEQESLLACKSCRLLLKTSREYVKCYRQLLRNAQELFLDDVQHHCSGVDAWERVLEALDASHSC